MWQVQFAIANDASPKRIQIDSNLDSEPSNQGCGFARILSRERGEDPGEVVEVRVERTLLACDLVERGTT